MGMARKTAKTTLLDLLMKLQNEDPLLSEKALIGKALRTLRSKRVSLCGNYAGTRWYK